MDVDADSCHDKIVPSVGMLALQKCGVSPKVCAVQGATLVEMKHNSMTVLGLSELDCQHCDAHPIHGMGQDSAASPVMWTVLLNHLIECHEHLGHSASCASPDRTIELDLNAVGFVDDCSCHATGDNTTPDIELINRMQKDAQLWRGLLNVTGGESSKQMHLSFHKMQFRPWWSSISEPETNTEPCHGAHRQQAVCN